MSTATDLIPVRALNQVTYCPRLYYLQYVDCVMVHNEHVEGGLFDHRRVDAFELANKTRTDRGAAISRGIALSSEALGVTGVLDVIEEKNGEQYPVETKHGKAPHDDDGTPTVWDNDAVQLCAQAMLLEDAFGKPVPRGFQFHAGSRERVEVQFTDDLRQRTRDAITRCQELAVLDSPPAPLPTEQRHRCFGCSLAPVCLPEETLYQLGTSATEEKSHPALTRVIPQSDDGAVLYLQEPGSFVGKRSEHLVVKKDGQELSRIPMHAVRQVVVVGNVQVSTQALETLAANEVGVSFVTGHGRFVGAFVAAPAKNVSLREAQFRKFADPGVCLELSRAVVRAKLSNQRALLMRSLRGSDAARGSDEPAARDLWSLLRGLDDVTSLESLLGNEGQGAAVYFGEFGRFLKQLPGGQGFDFTSRNRRPPRDPVNALLSFAYAMLAKDCFAAVCAVGFDPYKGFFHQGRHGKPSLALDLMEEFRAVIADSVVLTLVNNEMLTREDFVIWRDACQLTEAGRKAFFAAYEQRKATEVTHPVYGYKMTYARMLEVQARMLAAFVRGGIPSYTGFTVR